METSSFEFPLRNGTPFPEILFWLSRFPNGWLRAELDEEEVEEIGWLNPVDDGCWLTPVNGWFNPVKGWSREEEDGWPRIGWLSPVDDGWLNPVNGWFNPVEGWFIEEEDGWPRIGWFGFATGKPCGFVGELMTSPPVGSSGVANWVCWAEDDETRRHRRMIVSIFFWILANFISIFFLVFAVQFPVY